MSKIPQVGPSNPPDNQPFRRSPQRPADARMPLPQGLGSASSREARAYSLDQTSPDTSPLEGDFVVLGEGAVSEEELEQNEQAFQRGLAAARERTPQVDPESVTPKIFSYTDLQEALNRSGLPKTPEGINNLHEELKTSLTRNLSIGGRAAELIKGLQLCCQVLWDKILAPILAGLGAGAVSAVHLTITPLVLGLAIGATYLMKGIVLLLDKMKLDWHKELKQLTGDIEKYKKIFRFVTDPAMIKKRFDAYVTKKKLDPRMELDLFTAICYSTVPLLTMAGFFVPHAIPLFTLFTSMISAFPLKLADHLIAPFTIDDLNAMRESWNE